MANLVRDTKYIQEKGGKLWAYAECNSTGSLVGSWVNGNYRDKSKVQLSRPNKSILDEAGDVVTTVDDDDNTAIEIESLQDDSNTEEFLVYDTKGKYYSIIMASGKEDTTNQKLRYFPLTTIESDYSVDSPGRKPTIKITPLAVGSDTFPSSVPTWVSVASGSLSTASGRYHKVTYQTGSAIL